LPIDDFQRWQDYFSIIKSENPQEQLDNYFIGEMDDLGKQFLNAIRTIQK